MVAAIQTAGELEGLDWLSRPTDGRRLEFVWIICTKFLPYLSEWAEMFT
jgi:hypothetical protein